MTQVNAPKRGDPDFLDALTHRLSTAVLSDVLDDVGIRAQALPPRIRPLDENLVLQQHGLEPRVVLVLDYSHGGDAIVARPEVLDADVGHPVRVRRRDRRL